jgi:fructokinase
LPFDPNVRSAIIGAHEVAFPRFEAMARLATVVKMSDEDAAWLYPGASPDEVLEAVLALGPRLAAITLGSEGAIIVNSGHRVFVPAVPVTAVDTIGAGDTFMSSLVHAVLDGGSTGLDRPALERIGGDAVAAAALTVSRPGADLPWADELRGQGLTSQHH